MIRVLITEDSITAGTIMQSILNSDPKINVIGWAKNGKECIDLAKRLKPDVITMDIRMPVMDGLEATKNIMKQFPAPILIVSSTINEDLNITFNALKAGAVDVLAKPKFLDDGILDISGEELINKTKNLFRFRPGNYIKASLSSIDNIVEKDIVFASKDAAKGLIIGASTGGPTVLSYLLKNIPKDFPQPIFIAQHIARGFMEGLVNWLQKNSRINIKISKNNEIVKGGTVYFPPDNYHLGVSKGKKIVLNKEHHPSAYRPSIDFLMESAAESYSSNCLGIILTGMGKDGAKGMEAINRVGGLTISQNKECCVIYGMPKAAIEAGATQKICTTEQILQEIINWGNKK